MPDAITMRDITIWLTLLGLCGMTFITRCFFLLSDKQAKLSATWQRLLRYAPLAALSAIITPELLLMGEPATLAFTFNNPKLVGGVVAIAMCVATRNMFLTIGTGLLAFSCARLFVG